MESKRLHRTRRLGFALLLGLASQWAPAQEDGAPPPADTEDIEPASETPAPTPVAPADPLDSIGDVVHLKTGGSIKGQVMSPQRGAYPVEVISGVTINIPMTQVTSIDYDPYEPHVARQLLEEARQQGAGAPIASSKLSPELSSKMNAPISNSPDPLVVPFNTLVGVLDHLAKVCDVTIQIGEGVRNLPEERLAWAGDIPPGTTLFGLFQDTILPRYGDSIGVEFEFDRISIRLPAIEGE